MFVCFFIMCFFASLAPFGKNLDSKCTIYFEWPNIIDMMNECMSTKILNPDLLETLPKREIGSEISASKILDIINILG